MNHKPITMNPYAGRQSIRLKLAPALGFTLIELVCALALGAMVVTLLCGMVARMSQREKAWREKYPDISWVHRVREQIEQDFALSREVRWTHDRIEMQGYGPVDPGSNLARPSEIVYLIRQTGHQPLLLRAARDLLQPNSPVQRTVLAEGIDSFQWETGNRQGVNPGVVVLTLSVRQGEQLQDYSFPLVRQGVE